MFLFFAMARAYIEKNCCRRTLLGDAKYFMRPQADVPVLSTSVTDVNHA